jgi:hypothetical protein
MRFVHCIALCFAFSGFTFVSSQKCSVNVVSDPNLKDHPAFNESAPTLGSLHEAVEFVAAVFNSSSQLSDDDLIVCIFGQQSLTRPLVVDHLCTPPSQARVVWLGFNASISGAIQLQSWQQVSGGTYSTKVPQSFTGPTIR